MKRLIVIGFVVTILISATAAIASVPADNDWLLNFRATTDVAAKTGAATSTFGLKSTAGDYFAYRQDAFAGPEVNYSYAGDPLHSSRRYYIAKFGGAPLGSTSNVMSWVIRLDGYAYSSAYVTGWNASGATSSIEGFPGQTIKLYECNVAGDKLAPAIWTFTPGVVATWSAGARMGGTSNVDYFQKMYTFGAADAEGLSHQYLLLEATVPEPSSILAVISGLAGVLGLRIRRRK